MNSTVTSVVVGGRPRRVAGVDRGWGAVVSDGSCDPAGSGAVEGAGAVVGTAGGARSGQNRRDLSIAVALGGDCAADIALVRAQPEVFGPVASDPTVSRLICRLAADEEAGIREHAVTNRARRLPVVVGNLPQLGALGQV